MNNTKSIVTGARPTAIRGGRLRKRGSQVVSFAPHFADLLSGASRVALGGVLILTGVAALAPTSAMAAPCGSGAPNVITLCHSPADPDGNDVPSNITVDEPGTRIETAEGFGLDSSNGYSDPAINLTADNDADVLFLDENQSIIRGSMAGISATNTGNGNTSITTDGVITSTLAATGIGIAVTSSGSGDASVTASGSVNGDRGILVRGTATSSGNLGITTTTDSSVTATKTAINAWQYGDGNITIITAGEISSSGGKAIEGWTDGNGNITIDNSAELNAGTYGIIGFNEGADGTEGDVTITNSGEITDSNVGIAGLSTANGTVSITNTADIESRNETIRAWHVGAGDIIVDNSGDLYSNDQSSANSFGISAFTDDAGNITITNSGAIDAAIGIHAQHDANGNISITNNNLIEARIGINAIHNGTGTLTVTTGDDSVINAAVSHPELGTGGNGINAWHYGDGNVTVTTSGSITSAEGDAINAYSNGTGDISVNNNAILEAADHGIFAFNNAADGTVGNVTITNNGAITSDNVGIAGLSHADGNVTITNTADIESQNESIRAWHVGAGNIIVDNSGKLTSTDSFGISAFTDDSGDITSTNSGTITALIGMHAQHNADGLITQTNNGTINAVIGMNLIANGAADIIATNGTDGTIESTKTGIYAKHTDDGNISITNAGTITNNVDQPDPDAVYQAENAIWGVHSGAGNITISNSGTINALLIPSPDNNGGSSHGIVAEHFGNGDIVIDNSGTIKSDFDGIGADHLGVGDGNISITNSNQITAKDDGIFVTRQGSYTLPDAPSIISVTNTGTIQAGDKGVVAYVYNPSDGYNFVDVNITNSGTISARNEGIIVQAGSEYTVGDIVVTNSGIITSTRDDAIFVGHGGTGDITVNNTGKIKAKDDGIDAHHFGIGDIRITNGSQLDAEGDAIQADPDATGDKRIKIKAKDDAIQADHDGTGDVVITTHANSTLIAGDDGIQVYHAGTGNIDINNAGRIKAEDLGIRARHIKDGDINVTNSGTIKSDDSAIYVSHYDEGEITITNDGNITAGDNGIDAYHASAGAGSITITNAGKIAADDYAIFAAHYGVGNIDITNYGTITAGAAGIRTKHKGDGDISITNDGTITATDTYGFGIVAHRPGEGDVTITNSGNVSGRSAALLAVAEQGTVTITNTNSGTITGTITTAGSITEFDPDLGEFVTTIISGNDSFTNDGTWNTAGSTNNFGLGDDIVINNGTIHGANASFVGLENFINNGTLTMVNNVAGDTLTTDGDMSFGANSRLILEMGNNNVDYISADGDITLDGGKLDLVSTGQRLTNGRYTVLTANNVYGTFADDSLQDTAFLDLDLDYTHPARVELTVSKVVDFADVAQTPNQLAVADSLDALASGNALIDELLYLPSADAARTAFDQLSGEVHATQHTALADDSRLSRNAVLNRLQNQDGSTIWGELFFGTGDLDQAKHRNTGSSKRDAWGFILGADAAITDNIVVGLAGSMIKHESDNQLRSNATTSEIETAHLLAYVGAESGKARFKLGAGYAWGDVTTARTVSFGRFTDRLTADYDAKLFQAFAELGYRLPLGGGYVEPMANVIYIDTTTDAFTEKGGLAALSAEKRSEKTTLSTLGARFSTAQSGIFSLNGMAGWQHGFGKLTPSSVLNFAGFASSDSFTIAGAPQSRDAAVMQVEAKLDAGSGMSVGLGYDGIVGTAGNDHAAKISVRMKF